VSSYRHDGKGVGAATDPLTVANLAAWVWARVDVGATQVELASRRFEEESSISDELIAYIEKVGAQIRRLEDSHA